MLTEVKRLDWTQERISNESLYFVLYTKPKKAQMYKVYKCIRFCISFFINSMYMYSVFILLKTYVSVRFLYLFHVPVYQ